MNFKKIAFTLSLGMLVWMSSILATSTEPDHHKISLKKWDLQKPQGTGSNLLSGDFDEDGIPDLVVTGSAGGSGFLSFYRGNADSIYPTSPESLQRKAKGLWTGSPFLPEAVNTFLPESADFAGAGDFDADGHLDIVSGKRGSNVLFKIPGNGRGEFDLAKSVILPGNLTALAVGDVNRKDGLPDVVAGINGKAGAELLVYEGPGGAFHAKPERHPISAVPDAIEIADLDDDFAADVVAATGTEVVVIHGRDRNLSADEKHKSLVPVAVVERLGMQAAVRSIAVGDFTGDRKKEIAILSVDGNITYLQKEKDWKLSSGPRLSGAGEKLLASVRVSGDAKDDLVVKGSVTKRLHIVNEKKGNAASMDTGGDALAVLPMRLNRDAIPDVVILTANGIEMSVSSPAHIFTVNSTADTSDFTTADDFCDTDDSNNDGPCTLRAAIEQANASSGADEIDYSIGSGVQTITPLSAFQIITDAVTIDGTTQSGFSGSPLIELDGTSAGPGVTPLLVTAGSSVIRGLVIHDFSQGGIRLDSPGNGNIVEGNYVGTNVAGTVALGPNGVVPFGSNGNTIGGTTASARNLIAGIQILGSTTTGNVIQGNFIGVNVSGTASLGATGAGISINGGGNTVGGTTAGARNIISGKTTGISIGNISGILVQGNYIGTDVTGTVDLGNSSDGIQIAGPNNTIGGTTSPARNIISGNNFRGVEILGAGTDNFVQGNYIGTNANGTAAISNSDDGVHIVGSSNTIGGTTAGAGNVISGNGNAGVRIRLGGASDNLVAGNKIGLNATGNNIVGNATEGVDIEQGATNNVVGGNIVTARNVISGNSQNGVYIGDSTTSGNTVQGNYIGTNAAGSSAKKNLFHGIFINDSPFNTIGGFDSAEGNLISGNAQSGINIEHSNSHGNQVLNNIIGGNPNATSAIVNGNAGISVGNGAHDNQIGDAGAGNRIIGKVGGVLISDSGTNNNGVFANWIGWPASTTPKGYGIQLQNSANGNVIGTVADGMGNRIENCGGVGARVKDTTTDNNSIRGNSILNNGGIGIDILSSGVSLNDAGDPDTGSNQGMNFPVIATAFTDGETATITGSLNTSSPNTASIDLYASTTADPTGYGEGELYLGSATPNGGGNWSATVDAIGIGSKVTATATDSSGNTSEFSLAFTTIGLPSVSINDVSIPEGNSGTTNAVFTVTLSQAISTQVNVNFTTADDSANQPDDYTLTTGICSIPANQLTCAISVPVVGDTDGESNEAFFVNLTAVSSGNATIFDGQGVGTIADDEGTPNISINDVAVAETDSGTVNATFTISLPSTIGSNVTVDFATANGTALAPGDYTTTSGTATILANTLSTTISVPVAGDNFLEGDETFFVNLTNPTNAAIVDAQGMGVILESPDLVATALSSSSIQLNWSDPNEDEAGFRVERSTDGISFIAINILGPNTLTYTDGGRSAATLYYYRVIPFTSLVDVQRSNIAAATTFPTQIAKVLPQQVGPQHNWALWPGVAWNGTKWGMAYQDRTGGNNDEIFFRLLNADGSTFGSPVQITNTDAISQISSLQWNGTHFGLLWSEQFRGPAGEVTGTHNFALLDSNGNPIRKGVRILGTNPIPAIKTNFTPGSLVWDGSAWGLFVPTGLGTTNDEVTYYRLDEDGDILTGPVQITTTPSHFIEDVSAAFSGTQYGVSYTRFKDSTTELFFQRVNTNGTLDGSTTLIATNTTDGIQSTDIVWDATNFVVVWDDIPDGDVEIVVRLQKVNASGGLVGTTQRLSDDSYLDAAVDDELPQIFNKSGGGYLVYTSSASENPNTAQYGMARLEANASGVRVGPRIFLTADDGNLRFWNRAATDGTNFLVAYNDEASTQEVGDLVVDSSGAVIPGGGPRVVTSGHSPSNPGNFFALTSTQPFVIPLQSGFVTIWSEPVAFNSSQIYAKIFDGSGALTATKFPLSTSGLIGRPAAIAVGNTFAVSWKDQTNTVRFGRFDASGNPIGSESQVATSAGGSNTGLDFSGEEYGVAWRDGGKTLAFQRLDTNGNLLGSRITIPTINASPGPGPQVRWVGSGWAIIFGQTNDLYYARLDSSGAVIVSPRQVTFTSTTERQYHMIWNGSELGLVWLENRGPNPPGPDIFYTVLNTDGIKSFTEIAVVSTELFDNFPILYWANDRFKLVHTFGTTGGLREIDLFTNGTTGATRLLAHREGQNYAAFNGVTAGIAFLAGGRNELHFETTQTLTDVTAPPCPSASGGFDGTKITINWGAVSDAESGIFRYFLYRDGTMLMELNPTSTSFQDFGFHSGDNVYELRAMNGAYLESTGCSTVTVNVSAGSSPSGLTNNTAADLSACADTGVQITWLQNPADWGDGGSGTRTYDVLRDDSPIVTGISYGTTTYTDTTGVNGTTYTYKVRYNNGTGQSATTSPGASAADIIGTAPSSLTNNSAADLNACADTGVQITWAQDAGNWGDNGTGTRTYDVLRAGSPIVSGLTYGTTSFTDTTGTNGVSFSYTIRYNNGCGLSTTTSGVSAADNVSGTTETANQSVSKTATNNTKFTPLSPNFTITTGQATSATLSWTLSGTTNLTVCAKIELASPTSVKTVVKDFGVIDPGSASVLSFYQTYGPGQYQIFLTEKTSCDNGTSTQSASIASTQMVVQSCP